MPLTRRGFLQTGAGAALGVMSAARGVLGAGYRVGVGRDPDPYAATVRALDASGEWPAVAGKTVVVKPNLVIPATSDTGATTDPEVVRAVVDRALADGALEALIVETSPQGAHFSACGYDGFDTYNPRVRLVDLGTLPVVLAAVPGGLAYQSIYTPDLMLRDDIVFVSVGKLKTHAQALTSLSTKNLFGVPAVDRYVSTPSFGRFAMHDRGLDQAIIDVNRLRPSHFAVIDGIWGMEGNGPAFGTPVRADTVLAGRNTVAVDRVALSLMQVPQVAVRHLAYAARFGLGPSDVSEVTVGGDPLETRAFALPSISPVVEYPRVVPAAIRPPSGQRASIVLWYGGTCLRRLQVVRLYEESTQIDLVRTLADYQQVASGYEWSSWDGRDDGGHFAPPGRYAVHVCAFSLWARVRNSGAVGWVTVIA
jgi:uncharacterized protein (DUF362 family)